MTRVRDVRERAYASIAVWAGMYLAPGATIAANEIGAIGFFLPRHMNVLDMFGLLRPPALVRMPYPRLVQASRPEMIVSRTQFAHRPVIEAQMKGAYSWHEIGRLNVGIREDSHRKLGHRLPELASIYQAMDVDKEYDWGSR